MKAHETKKSEDERARGLYVYCIGERAALTRAFADAPPVAMEADGALDLIEHENLAAVASSVPLSDYGENELQTRLTDATWTAIRAMRHEKVVEHFARRASVVPLRFGTIYLERAGVGKMMSERRARLSTIIERLNGREEWGLNLYFDRAKLLENIVSLSARLRELSESAESASPGQSYLMRKKIDALRETEARAETKRLAAEVERELSKVSGNESKRLRVLKDEGGAHGDVAAKFAFLVKREHFDEFRQTAERLAREYAATGFSLELTGPWPAYNFASE